MLRSKCCHRPTNLESSETISCSKCGLYCDDIPLCDCKGCIEDNYKRANFAHHKCSCSKDVCLNHWHYTTDRCIDCYNMKLSNCCSATVTERTDPITTKATGSCNWTTPICNSCKKPCSYFEEKLTIINSVSNVSNCCHAPFTLSSQKGKLGYTITCNKCNNSCQMKTISPIVHMSISCNIKNKVCGNINDSELISISWDRVTCQECLKRRKGVARDVSDCYDIEKTSPDQETRQDSNNVDYKDKLTTFLYLLMRDHLSTGTVAKIQRQCDEVKVAEFTNGWLADYAHHMAEHLNPITNVNVDFSAIPIIDEQKTNQEVDRLVGENKLKWGAAIIDRLIEEFEKVLQEMKSSDNIVVTTSETVNKQIQELKTGIKFLETVVLNRLHDIRKTYKVIIAEVLTDPDIVTVNRLIKDAVREQWLRANKAEWNTLDKLKEERLRIISIIDKQIGFDRAAIASHERSKIRLNDLQGVVVPNSIEYCDKMIHDLLVRIQSAEVLKRQFIDGME